MTTGDMAGSLTSAEGEEAMRLMRELRAAGVDVEKIKRQNPIPRDLLATLREADEQRGTE